MSAWMIRLFVFILERLLSSDMLEEYKVALIKRLRERAADTESPIDDLIVEFFAAVLGVD